jgi:proteic killer suppression protein
MEISFKDEKLKKTLENHKLLQRKYGQEQAMKIVQRINELTAAENLYDITRLPQARLHSLSGNLKGCLAVDIKHPYRLILNPNNGDLSDYKSITKIQIKDIIDYH